jgi:hypothetical protein
MSADGKVASAEEQLQATLNAVVNDGKRAMLTACRDYRAREFNRLHVGV